METVNYPAMAVLVAVHVLALLSLPYLYFYGFSAPETAFHLIAYPLGGLGITALYHRSWTHNAVRLHRAVEYVLAACATFVLQNPARQWISTHITHHAHTDHEADPYNIQNGFAWAHYEWIIYSPPRPVILPERLANNPVIIWQEKYYWPISILLNFAIPVALALLVGAPWWGGVLVSALRMALMSHVVFAVNSVCHIWGSQKFSTDNSARDVWWFPFALGEQYHNYHHAFPRDYRHGIGKFDFDPTKWFIQGLAAIGLADGLRTMQDRQIESALERVRTGKTGEEAERTAAE
jgi:stearoyl-CoA desaturase (Delta-9 desaturase)